MVSRNFLIQQACLNTIQDWLPMSTPVWGAAAGAKDILRICTFADNDHGFFRDVRQHFAILDRREREAADIVRLDTWREAVGSSGIK